MRLQQTHLPALLLIRQERCLRAKHQVRRRLCRHQHYSARPTRSDLLPCTAPREQEALDCLPHR